MSKKIIVDEKDFISFDSEHSRIETAKRFGISLSSVDRTKLRFGCCKKTNRYKDINVGFTNKQIEIITGSMLGDGSLSKIINNRNSLFREVHGFKQYDYLMWKYNELQPFSGFRNISYSCARKIENGKVVRDESRQIKTCVFQTIKHPWFTEMEKKWYKRNDAGAYVLYNNRRIKIIPNDLKLTPLSLAVWFFDDGSHSCKHRQILFNTHAYSFEECWFLVELLKKFGFDCAVVKNREKPIIQFRTRSYLDFVHLVSDYLPCECMRYKVDLSKYVPPNYSTRFQTGHSSHYSHN